MSNIPGGMMRAADPSKPKELVMALPVPSSTPFPLIDAADDTGKWIKAILLKRDRTLGKRIYGATDYYTGDEIVQQVKEVKSGVEATYLQISPEDFMTGMSYAGYSEKGQIEMLQNLQFMPEFGYYGKAELADSLAVRYNFLVFGSGKIL